MTVAELIQRLQAMDPQRRAVVWTPEGCYKDIWYVAHDHIRDEFDSYFDEAVVVISHDE
jgi:hypothetical protein